MRRTIGLSILVVLLGCGDPAVVASPVMDGMPGITVTPPTVTMPVNTSLQLTVGPADRLRGHAVSWVSSDTLVVTVSQDGRVSSRRDGSVTIAVNLDGVGASAAIVSVATPSVK